MAPAPVRVEVEDAEGGEALVAVAVAAEMAPALELLNTPS
jgi:hypothetical protein